MKACFFAVTLYCGVFSRINQVGFITTGCDNIICFKFYNFQLALTVLFFHIFTPQKIKYKNIQSAVIVILLCSLIVYIQCFHCVTEIHLFGIVSIL